MGDRGQAWNHFKSFCANTRVCCGPTLFTQAVPIAHFVPGSPPWPVPTPYPLGGPTPREPLSTSPPPITPACLLPHPRPQNSMPATLGQSLPTPWAICQGDGSFSKKQNLLPSWPSYLLGFSHRSDGRQLLCFRAQWHEGSLRMNGQSRWQRLPGGDAMTRPCPICRVSSVALASGPPWERWPGPHSHSSSVDGEVRVQRLR